MRRTALATVVLLVALVTFGAGAGVASGAGDPVIRDCRDHAMLTKTYSIGQLQHALSTMDAATKEYTSCPDVINRALSAALAKGGKGGTGSGGSGSFLPTPVIIVLVLLVLAAVTFGAVAVRRRQAGGSAAAAEAGGEDGADRGRNDGGNGEAG